MSRTQRNGTQRSESSLIDNKKDYLALLQEPIGRLSTASSVFKGFAATIVTGIAALSYSEIDIKLLVLSFVPILAFAALDVFYLRLEKRYRGLYNDVLSGEHGVDFSITLPADKQAIKRAKATIWHCILSPSIWLFYPAMFVVLALVCIMKANGGL